MSKSRGAYACNYCDHDDPRNNFYSKSAMAAHYRRRHPEAGYNLWDATGSVGDKFADGALLAMQERWHEVRRELDKVRIELAEKSKLYDQLLLNFNELQRRLQIIQLTLK